MGQQAFETGTSGLDELKLEVAMELHGRHSHNSRLHVPDKESRAHTFPLNNRIANTK